jgi:hypothetical protein
MSIVFFRFDPKDGPVLDSDVLNSLKEHRLGIIARAPKEKVIEALKASGVADYFDEELFVRRSDDADATYSEVAKRARVTEDAVYYVDADREEIGRAAGNGLQAVHDPSHISLVGAISQLDTSGMADCVADEKAAGLNSDPGPSGETNFQRMLQRLEAAKVRLPPLYVNAAEVPFVAKLNSLDSAGFTQILANGGDPALLLQDIAHSILQNGEKFEDTATDAFEEVVTDLYDGFLSAQDRNGIKTPDRLVLPPLVKWGNPDFGPYTWPGDATASFGVQCAVVNMPPTNAKGGLMAWAALAHETAGHDILHADKGLQAEIAGAVQNGLKDLNFGLADYWSARIDETASDVMGILNMGPAAAMGMIGFFRGLLASLGRAAQLRNDGPAGDSHPADILRGYLGAAVVRRLSFTAAPQWANAIESETERDVAGPLFKIGGIAVPKARAKQSAQVVAEIIATRKMQALRNHALIEIQDWRDADEAIAQSIIPALTTANALPANVTGIGVFAAHVVSAAVVGALARTAPPATIFKRMITVLKAMHDGNPAWGPLHVLHPSSIYRDMAYCI